MAVRQADPYSVVLKQNKLPMSLLQESQRVGPCNSLNHTLLLTSLSAYLQLSRPNLTSAEPFSDTFGPRAQRKRPRIDVGTFEELAQSGLTKLQPKPIFGVTSDATVEEENAEAQDSATTESMARHEQDLGMDEQNETQRQHQKNAELRNAPLDYILAAGTSKRIWAELYKVIDSSDIILHVLDARDPLGTRCDSVENYLAKEKRSKKVIYILNKVDLIPGWAAVSCPLLAREVYSLALLLCPYGPIVPTQQVTRSQTKPYNHELSGQPQYPLRKTADSSAGRLAPDASHIVAL